MRMFFFKKKKAKKNKRSNVMREWRRECQLKREGKKKRNNSVDNNITNERGSSVHGNFV